MNYCQRCVLPDTRPNLVLDGEGVCNACRAHATKPIIDYASRSQVFDQVVANTLQRAQERSQSQGRPVYDCLIPVSGGKDSTWQVVTCLEHGLNPLAVTWKTPARTPIGQRNLDNLVSLGVDHVDYQINPKVERRFMLEALIRNGDPAIPMHMALFNIPLTLAVRYRIPLVVWGENSAFEYGGTAEEQTGFELDQAWLKTFGVTHGTTAADWVSESLSPRDLTGYYGPTGAELQDAGVQAIFLGYYFKWDPERSLQVARAHGFESDAGGPRTGYYDFADIDDDFISIHHYIKWYKFGFTRLFDNLSLEIRNGRLSRERALELIAEAGEQIPQADIESFCEFTDLSENRFWEILETFRNRDVWQLEQGVWQIKDFIIKDWSWT